MKAAQYRKKLEPKLPLIKSKGTLNLIKGLLDYAELLEFPTPIDDESDTKDRPLKVIYYQQHINMKDLQVDLETSNINERLDTLVKGLLVYTAELEAVYEKRKKR